MAYIPIDKSRGITPRIDKKINYIAGKYKRLENVEVVQKGDTVRLDVESSLPRYKRKNVPVTVGGNLYSEELELSLIGHKTGETFHTTVEKTDVKVTILDAKRSFYPEVTDEMAKEAARETEGMEGVTTVSEYRERTAELYFQEQRLEYIFDKTDEIIAYMMQNSGMEPDEAELDALYRQIVNDSEAAAQQELGKALNEMTREELMIYTDTDNLEDYLADLKNQAETELFVSLLLCTVQEKVPENTTIDDVMEHGWDSLSKYIEKMTRFKFVTE